MRRIKRTLLVRDHEMSMFTLFRSNLFGIRKKRALWEDVESRLAAITLAGAPTPGRDASLHDRGRWEKTFVYLMVDDSTTQGQGAMQALAEGQFRVAADQIIRRTIIRHAKKAFGETHNDGVRMPPPIGASTSKLDKPLDLATDHVPAQVEKEEATSKSASVQKPHHKAPREPAPSASDGCPEGTEEKDRLVQSVRTARDEIKQSSASRDEQEFALAFCKEAKSIIHDKISEANWEIDWIAASRNAMKQILPQCPELNKLMRKVFDIAGSQFPAELQSESSNPGLAQKQDTPKEIKGQNKLKKIMGI